MPVQKSYHGKETTSSLKNFPPILGDVSKNLIYNIVIIKKAACMAHRKTGELSEEIAESIFQACQEFLSGNFDNQLKMSAIQGGAGTSINMMVNEIISNRASEISGIEIHPLNHVNKSQSTNDVNPSALKITLIKLCQNLIEEIELLNQEIDKKIKKFGNIKKLGRTHFQDAVPMTVGQEIGAWKAALERDALRFKDILKYLAELNLGGTAIGNSVNASIEFRESLYTELNKLIVKDISVRLNEGKNLFSLTSTSSDFVHVMSIINILALDLSKIANDIRFLTSGPNGGIGEYRLRKLQAGSSIMPGKVNPIMPEFLNQIFYNINGKTQTVILAAESARLQLSNMFPIIAFATITAFEELILAISQFRKFCIAEIVVNKDICMKNLTQSTAYVTQLVPIYGYDKVAKWVEESIENGISVYEIIKNNSNLSEKDIDSFFNKLL